MAEVNMISFLPHDKLSPKIWNDDNKMKEKVREALLLIANEFLDYLKIDIDISDITVTGSYANYNYTPYSDIDLHIVIEFADISNNEELIEGFMAAKRSYWNDKYDIKVNNIDVEIYPQDASEEHISSGIYSIDKNEWVVSPEKFVKIPDVKSAKKKANMLKREITRAIESEDLKEIERLIVKIKNMRSSGLEKSGEMSIENIVYKMLRSDDMVQKLYNSKFKAYSDSLSI
jgi:predicted nucleotidyltransferase